MTGASHPTITDGVRSRLRAASLRFRPGQARRRRQRLEAAVPEVLDVLRATVAAGAAPCRALRAAAEVGPPPLQRLLADAVRAADLGAGAGQALAAVGRREPLAELVLAGEALDLAEATGAPPARVLAGVAAAASDRVRATQATLAATAQARLSAHVVAALAPAYLALLAVISPADVTFLVRGRFGWATLATAAVLQAAGIWWADRIVRGTR